MLKTTRSPEMSAFRVGDGEDKVDRFSVSSSSGKLPQY